ncbi:MAG TPA: tRNA1(Val) (adenine(37)-N6)-methyltransferase [Dissulfurispiraceae bacterium]|nr:tRNA1(Val) (adenine(37)-N6)-methyltransferase [Dissulfurispiraceae bacterium]
MTTLDFIRDVRICQHKNGYRFSVDALLVDAFVTIPRVKCIADLCAGSGIIGLLLAKRYQSARITLVELQKSLVRLAEKNVALNSLNEQVSVVHADIKEFARANPVISTDSLNAEDGEVADEPPPWSEAAPAATEKTQAQTWWSSIIADPCFDLVVANPPFRPLKSGKLSNGDEKAIARHEIALSLNDLVSAATRMLRHHGRFCFIHLPERLSDICIALRQNGCEAKRIRFVHSSPGTEAKMLLVEAVKGGKPGLEIEKPLFLYDDKGDRSEELASFYARDHQSARF